VKWSKLKFLKALNCTMCRNMSTQKTRLLLETLSYCLKRNGNVFKCGPPDSVLRKLAENFLYTASSHNCCLKAGCGGWWKQQVGRENYALRSFVIKLFKSGSMRWVGNVARTGKNLNGNKILVCQLNAKKGHVGFNDKGILFLNRTF